MIKIVTNWSRSFEFHFDPIDKGAQNQRNKNISPICIMQMNNIKHHPNNYQSEQMSPNKFQDHFYLGQDFLDIVHMKQTLPLYITIVADKWLKKC
jgi:hypothetical protein